MSEKTTPPKEELKPTSVAQVDPHKSKSAAKSDQKPPKPELDLIAAWAVIKAAIKAGVGDPPNPDELFAEFAAHIDVQVLLPDPAKDIVGFVPVLWTERDPGDPRLTDAKWTLRKGGPDWVKQDPATGRLIVKEKPAVIAFNIGPGTRYRLAGVAFKMVRGKKDSNGHRNMPKEDIRLTQRADGSSTIYVTNRRVDFGEANSWNWDFFLMVQDDTGAIGIIDPDIENQQ
jgi:hypothetical protein